MKLDRAFEVTVPQSSITIVGEEIEGAWNAQALRDLSAAMGSAYCDYRSQAGDAGDLLDNFDHRVAADNDPRAVSVYAYRLPRDWARPALILGNEAKGIRRRTLKQCDAIVEVPVVSRNINCLNVAAAAAAVMYYLGRPAPLPHKPRTLTAVQRDRPDLLLVAGQDPMELGSVVRSACAFGWDRVLLDDPHGAWYACDRVIRSEGRGAARRGRNPIRVAPLQRLDGGLAGYDRLVVCTARAEAPPLDAVALMGRRTLLVLPDEAAADVPWQPPTGDSARVRYAALPSAPASLYHYRQSATVALAECARQLGRPDSAGIYLPRRRDRYRRELEPAADEAAVVWLDELAVF